MRVSILREKRIENIILPDKIFGNFWITDRDVNGIQKNLISIEAKNDKWILVSNNEATCTKDSVNLSEIELLSGNFYTILKEVDNHRINIYCSSVKEKFQYIDISDYLQNGITIGKENSFINYSILNTQVISIIVENNEVVINILDNNQLIYMNDIRILNKQKLKIGDIVFVNGLKFFLVKSENKYYLAINNPNIPVSCQAPAISDLRFSTNTNFEELQEEKEMFLYDENDYFHRMPRFISNIKPIELKVDAPPAKREDSNTPFLLTIGPMLTMSMTSMVTGYTAVNNVLSGKADWSSAAPSLIICVAMFASVFVWPIFTKKYQKKEQKRQESLRQEKYKKYIDEKKEIIRKGIIEQSNILKNSYPTTKECEQIILNKYVSLWQRRIEDSDFLELNLGFGNYPMKIDIQYPEEHFSMVEDNLKEIVFNLGNEPKTLVNVPVPYSLIKNSITGVIGNYEYASEFIKQLIIQTVAFHSYDNVKIIVLTNDENSYKWDFIKKLPHNFTDDKSLRFFATNNDEYKEICYYLDRIISKRIELLGNNNKPEIFEQNYLIITDSFKAIRNYDAINKILTSKKDFGFMLMILDSKVTNLPDQCKSFMQIAERSGEVQNNVMGSTQKFNIDTESKIRYEDCAIKLANIPIEITSEEEGKLPNKVGFLEMYDVGKVEQLNALARWQNHNPIQHLESPVGIGKNGEIISIDLHEKYHGPHGLIAGMTGSGKSEFIITYILSMAINYHPYEVQFILIDYKGGGLAGAFENKITGVKLPHLVGTITNLDANEIKRSLSSIESELKRRQALFNKARELSGESTVDIYKYQKMYRDGIVDEPVSHLFIISDEFAELKTQQPEFMAQLNSTARIGRSLGVHLILATQKPSGVVDAQIWSNSRFRICMKVQEKSDSNEVIKTPDAAFLKQTGRFYFQVGYNEVFTLGQAAWAGGKYYPNEKVIKNIDSSIDFINDIGYITKSVETKEKNDNIQSQGEELSNIVKYLDNLANLQKIKCTPLWLEKIPDFIKVEDLSIKYNYQKEDFIINPIIGEYDIPAKQQQCLLTLPLTNEGNALIYGAGGSGKENFITTLIYSSMLYYTPEELNYYILDFGSEVLKMFDDCPLVGDTITLAEDEELANLYKMLNSKIEERKELFADYNGDYLNYCKNSGKTVPNIVVIINNFESYQESYSKYDEMLSVLTRECTKYGIYFVITVNTPNGIRMKLKQNFATVYALQQNNDDDYMSILGNVHKTYPAKIFGRGIIKTDDVYEFQTALVTERDDIPNYVKQLCLKQKNEVLVKASKIPILPKVVDYTAIKSEFGNGDEYIIGIEKDSLKVSKFDFFRNYITVLTGLEINFTSRLLNPLLNQILALNKSKILVLNAEDYYIDSKYSVYYEYITKGFDEIIEKLFAKVEKDNELYEQNGFDNSIFDKEIPITCVIIGINAIKNKLSDENKTKLNDIFTKAKELDNIHFIFVDSIDQFKKIELESWYKNNVNTNSGIWVGSGLGDQFTIKLSSKIDEMKGEVPENFCFVVNRGRPTYVKFVESLELQTKKN